MGTMLAACLPGSWLANTAPKRHLFPLSFKRLGISCHWCLGITGMTTMLPLFCLPWELWRWHCVSRVSLIRAVHTPSTAEGNVSRTLQVMVTDSVTGLAEQTRRDKWIPQGRTFNSFLSFCSLSSPDILWTCFSSYLPLPYSPCSWPFVLCSYLLVASHFSPIIPWIFSP